MLALASLLFGEEEHLGRILLVETPRAKKARQLPRRKQAAVAAGEVAEVAPRPTAPQAGAPPAD